MDPMARQVGWPGLIIVEGEERNVAASWFFNNTWVFVGVQGGKYT